MLRPEVVGHPSKHRLGPFACTEQEVHTREHKTYGRALLFQPMCNTNPSSYKVQDSVKVQRFYKLLQIIGP